MPRRPNQRFIKLAVAAFWYCQDISYLYQISFLSLGYLTRKSGVQGSIPGLAHTFVSPSAFSRRAVVSYCRKFVHGTGSPLKLRSLILKLGFSLIT